MRERHSAADIIAPLVTVSENDGDTLFVLIDHAEAANTILNATMTQFDSNPWGELYEGTTFVVLFQGGFSIVHIIACILCVQRIMYWRDHDRRKVMYAHVPVTILSLELAGNVVRLFYIAYDPLRSQGRLSFLAGDILQSVTAPWAFLSTILIVLFWQEVLFTDSTGDTKREVQFLPRMKGFFYTVAVALIGLDLTLSILVGTFRAPVWFFQLVSIFYLVVNTAMAIFMIVVGLRVIKRFRQEVYIRTADIPLEERGKRQTVLERQATGRIHRMTHRIIVSCIGMIILSLSLLCFIFPFALTPEGYVIVWACILIAIQMTSYAQILTL
jgi:hypothetical protein